MKYRVATIADYPAITAIINESGYYGPMAATDLDGPIIVAEREDGTLAGCLWAMVCGRHAFLDYFVAPKGSGRIAFMLALGMEKLLKERGVQYVRANIISDNDPALRVARSVGMATVSGYDLAYKRLQDGHAKD